MRHQLQFSAALRQNGRAVGQNTSCLAALLYAVMGQRIIFQEKTEFPFHRSKVLSW